MQKETQSSVLTGLRPHTFDTTNTVFLWEKAQEWQGLGTKVKQISDLRNNRNHLFPLRKAHGVHLTSTMHWKSFRNHFGRFCMGLFRI